MSIFHIMFTERIKVHLKFKGQKNSILWNFRRVNSSGWKMGFSMSPPQVFVTIYICEDKPDTFIIYAQKYCFHTFIMQKEKLNRWYPSFPFLFEIFFMENFRCDWPSVPLNYWKKTYPLPFIKEDTQGLIVKY